MGSGLRSSILKSTIEGLTPFMHSVSVSQFLLLVNESLRLIPSQDFVVEGEISDFRIAQEKWVSFDLKDEKEEAILKCFMTTWQLKVAIEDGMRVQIKGYPKVYERYGQFKMNVTEVEPVGEGALRRAYELVKKKLEQEGFFEETRKRTIPRFPERVGLITSRDAAAYGDFIRVMNNRWGGVDVLFTHVHVQGREAVPEILHAFSFFNALSVEERPDVLVLTRGGGGLEDLHAFNDESVARAVFGSVIPVVCAVGHERDESLCDFVADVRASTPSNAAERVVPNRQEILYEMQTMTRHTQSRLQDHIEQYTLLMHRATQLFGFILERHQTRIKSLFQIFLQRVSSWPVLINEKVKSLERVLRQLDPTRILGRGYSIVRVGGKILKQSSTLEIGSRVHVQLSAGSFDAEVAGVDGKSQQRLV